MDRLCPACGTPIPPTLREAFCAVCTLQGALQLGPRSHVPLPLLRRLGDYELLEEVARGGVGVVYRANQLGLGREVAVKLLIAGQFADPTARQRFQAEAESAARLRHPHIVEIFEIGDQDGQPFLAMEYLPGGDLADRVRQGPLPSREAAELTLKITHAVAAAHDAGILHRDLKPSNILLDAFGEPRLTDFGLAKLSQADPASHLTVSGQVLGSPGFMAPEQAQGRTTEVGRTADVYALGAVLYHLVTARAPFQGESAAAILRQVEREEPVPPRRLNPGVPRDLERIIQKCLEKTPARRYATAQDLAEDLRCFLDGRPVSARPLRLPVRLARWSRRRPALATSIVLLGAIAILSSLTAWRIGLAESAARLHLAQALQSAYAGDLALADRAIEDGDLARTRELLERHIPAPGVPDLRTFEWRLLWSLSSDQATAVLQGHQHVVSAVAFLPDGTGLVSGSWDGTVKVWSLAGHTNLHTLSDYPGQIWAIDVSHDGRLLLASGTQGFAVWQRDAPEAPWWFRGRILGDYSYGMARFLPDGRRVVVANRDGAQVWDIDTGLRLADLPEASSPVALSPDGTRLAARRGTRLSLFDTTTWQPVRHFKTGTLSSFGLRDLAFTPDGAGVVLGDARGWLGAVDLAGSDTNLLDIAPSRIHPQPHQGWVAQVAFSPDGQHFATVGADQRVLVWRNANRRLRFNGRGHRHEVWAAAFSPDNRWLATAGKDETIRLWDLRPASRSGTRSAPVRHALGPWDNTAILLDADPAAPHRQLRVYDWDTRRTNRVITIPTLARSTTLHFQAATGDLAAQTPEGVLEVWNLHAEPPRLRLRLADLPAPAATADPPCLARDGTLLARWTAETGAAFWSVPEGTLQFSLPDSGPILEIDPRWIFTRPVPATPRVYDRQSGRLVTDLKAHKEPVSRVLPLHDGRTVATAGWDGTLRFWELPSGRLLSTTRSQRQGVYALALSPDGHTLAAGGQDGVTHFWNVPTRQQTTRWVGRQIVHHLWFTPDGGALLVDLGHQLSILRVAPD